MTLAIGTVVVNPDGTETTTPGMGTDLYMSRIVTNRLPDPDHKKGCTVATDAAAGATTFEVDSSEGYFVGDSLGSYSYESGGHALQVKFTISALPDTTHITVVEPVPTGVTVKSGTQFGFKGSQSDWHDQVLPNLVKAKTALAVQSIGDATAIINHFKNFCDVNVRTTDSGLQRDSTTAATTGPSADKKIPSPGALS